MKSFSILILTLMVVVSATQAVAQNNEPGDCWQESSMVYEAVPDLFYSNQPDSLLGVLLAWEDICGESEPLIRIKILASIWDDGFTESIYDSRIIDYLIWRYDSQRDRKVKGEVIPGIASGNIAAPPDFAFHIADFDTFTMDLADQLLPHTPADSLERFYCLFYSGQVTAAYELLHGTGLLGTDLRWYYSRELSVLGKKRARFVYTLTSGLWRPTGDLFLVGNHPQFGFMVGARQDHWISRIVGEIRPGRSEDSYFVDQDGYYGWSDRWDGLYLGVEIGREIVSVGPHTLDAFVGLGYDGVKPFGEEDLLLGAMNSNFGFGYRLFTGKSRRWVVGVDYRFESIEDRNSGGTSLSGHAGTLRFTVGLSPDGGIGRRLLGLGR